MGGEIVTFWIGQCGIQMANSCWELLTLEHGITADGQNCDVDIDYDRSFENFFLETTRGKFIPRTLLVDSEPTVLDEIRLGKYRQLFSSNTLINSFEDAANNFARGFYSCGKEIIQKVVYMTRKTSENCDNISSFMIQHSLGGGTGSGFTAMLMEYLSVEYTKRMKIEYGVFPSPTFNVSVVEPYNTILGLHAPMENSDLVAFFENESLFHICQSNLEINEISYTTLNRMLAQAISGSTASLRFEGPLNANIIDFQTNLVPYPRIHFPLLTFYPYLGLNKIDGVTLSTKEITEQVFFKENQLTSISPGNGAYMSCCLLFRGNINILEANNAVGNLKSLSSMSWVDWCPTGFKVGINSQPMLVIPGSGLGYSSKSLSLLCNTTSFRSVLGKINRKCVTLFERKAFVHWFVGEGLEEIEFSEAIEDLLVLEKDYEMIESTTNSKLSETTSKTKSSVTSGSNKNVDIEISKSLTESSEKLTDQISNNQYDNNLQNINGPTSKNIENQNQYIKILITETESFQSKENIFPINGRMENHNAVPHILNNYNSSDDTLNNKSFLIRENKLVFPNEDTENIEISMKPSLNNSYFDKNDLFHYEKNCVSIEINFEN